MKILIDEQSIYFSGLVKDILNILSDYPPETTLKEYIRLHLN
jgi:hypothetical protein